MNKSFPIRLTLLYNTHIRWPSMCVVVAAFERTVSCLLLLGQTLSLEWSRADSYALYSPIRKHQVFLLIYIQHNLVILLWNYLVLKLKHAILELELTNQ